MIKLKGVYEWELKNADTGEIEDSGKQWNVISDKFLEWMFMGNSTSSNTFTLYTGGMAVQLSDSASTPGVDYRRSGLSNYFNILATGSTIQYNVDFTNLSKATYHNFPPPGASRIIRIIGVKVFQGTYDYMIQPNFVSFIELSTPITQNTNQYLYVSYTVFITPNLSLGNNTPNSRYINYGFNTAVFVLIPKNLGTWYTDVSSADSVRVTDLLPPVDNNKVHRNVPYRYKNVGADIQQHFGNIYGNTYYKRFAVSELEGPIGTVVYGFNGQSDISNSYYSYFHTTFGYSLMSSTIPSVSRVYVHPAGREGALFSDPSYPAVSQGTVVITGTPMNKFPVIGRVRVSKTGDASDLMDETVSYTAVDIGANSITVTQDIATGDMYRLTTTGVLPSPLVAATDYYVIRIDAVTIKLATTYAFAIAGTAIDITDQGSGNHTLIRQNTGEYKLENTLWTKEANASNMFNLSMAIDYDGYVMPHDLDSVQNNPTNYAEGDYIANNNGASYNAAYNDFCRGGSSSMLRGGLMNGDYIYTIQQSRKGLINNVCRWRFNTIETSEPICKFGTGDTRVGGVLDGGTKMYIYTNDGLYEYTFATPTVAPVLLTITGMIDNVIRDACIDPVTGYMWTGHATGLSRVDLGTLTATQYLRGTGQALDTLTDSEVLISGGQLDAYNGRVLKGGKANIASGDNYSAAWVMDDGVGFYRVKTTTASRACCLRRGTTEVVYLDSANLTRYNVVITGKNVGSSTSLETYAIGSSTTYYPTVIWGNLAQLSDDTFVYLYGNQIYSATSVYMMVATYKVGTPAPALWGYYGGSYAPIECNSDSHASYGYTLGALRRCPMYVDGNDAPMFLWHRYLIPTTHFTHAYFIYGWDGSNWVLNNPNGRKIPKTATHTLLNGLSVDFNNSTGGTWDKQFVSGEQYNFVHGPTFIKDNLQIVDVTCRKYVCEAHVVENYAVTVPMSAPYEITIPEVSDPDFRDMDTVDSISNIVKEGSTVYTQAWGTTVQYSANASTDILSVAANIPTGTPLFVWSSTAPYWMNCPRPLLPSVTYYAINMSTTTIKVALSYADALAGIAVDIKEVPASSGIYNYYQQLPNILTGTYRASSLGVFKFSAADAGKNLTITYTYTKFTS